MTKNEFMEAVKDEALAILREKDETIDAIISNVTKTNDIAYTGISFRGKSNIQPVVYLDSFFEQYEKGDIDVAGIAKTVADIYMANKWNHDFDMESITDFEKVKDHIIPCVYNTEANSENLKTMPSRQVVDLSIYYRLEIPFSGNEGNGYVTIHNNLMEQWNVSEEELTEIAWKNLRENHPYLFKNMFEVLNESILSDEVNIDEIPQDAIPMYILSNEDKCNGAVYMLDLELLNKIAKYLMNDDLVILPSSRHEVIVLPAREATEYEYLKSMVMEVNRTQVSDEDYLSDSVYFYNIISNELTKVA